MRAAAILGPGCSHKKLKPFQNALRPAFGESIDWRIGMPSVADEVDVILLFGGDGTIHRHLGQLVPLGLPVLVVPAGSGNDFARALGLRRVSDSLAAWRSFCAGQKNIVTVDLGVIVPLDPRADSRADPSSRADDVTGLAGSRKPEAGSPHSRYFCCAAGVGLDGEIARRANRMPRWMRAHGGYALSLAPALLGLAPFRVRIQTPLHVAKIQQQPGPETCDSHHDQRAVLAIFANTPFYGGGMKIAPRARMDDALLDVCLVADISRFKLFCRFPTVYFGRHLSMPEVKYFQSACLRVETEAPLDVYADGELVCRTPVEVSVQSGALKVLTA